MSGPVTVISGNTYHSSNNDNNNGTNNNSNNNSNDNLKVIVAIIITICSGNNKDSIQKDNTGVDSKGAYNMLSIVGPCSQSRTS